MLCSSQDVQSLLSGVVGQLLVPLDWVFLPLVGIYEKAIGAYVISRSSLLVCSSHHPAGLLYP